MKIGVIGAGHAGVEAAYSAVKAGADGAVLFSSESILPYYRPRLVALAFGQVDNQSIIIHPHEWYLNHKIDIKLESVVERIDAGRMVVVCRGAEHTFDALVIATGAMPAVPDFFKGNEDFVFPLWSAWHALKIREKVKHGGSILIIGGGVIGVEAALRAVDAGMGVTVVEKTDRLMRRDLSARGGETVKNFLEKHGVKVMLGGSVVSVKKSGAGIVTEISGGGMIESDVALITVGMSRDLGWIKDAGIAVNSGVQVDAFLQTSAAKVFAGGDIIGLEWIQRCSAHEAAVQGRTAGSNAFAVCGSEDKEQYKRAEVPLTFKYKDFEIHSIGAVPENESEEELLDDTNGLEYRARIVRNGVIVGVQMVGSGKGFQKYAAEVHNVT